MSGLWDFVEQKKIVCCKAVRKRKQSSFDRPMNGPEFHPRTIWSTDRKRIPFRIRRLVELSGAQKEVGYKGGKNERTKTKNRPSGTALKKVKI